MPASPFLCCCVVVSTIELTLCEPATIILYFPFSLSLTLTHTTLFLFPFTQLALFLFSLFSLLPLLLDTNSSSTLKALSPSLFLSFLITLLDSLSSYIPTY
ncbi:hypothetical protein BKA57DRAFT_111786 [Linnemannia elongata]|nr:hypothetical protein BKA57DRAFT_111786 [Linnemannia elongata]